MGHCAAEGHFKNFPLEMLPMPFDHKQGSFQRQCASLCSFLSFLSSESSMSCFVLASTRLNFNFLSVDSEQPPIPRQATQPHNEAFYAPMLAVQANVSTWEYDLQSTVISFLYAKFDHQSKNGQLLYFCESSDTSPGL